MGILVLLPWCLKAQTLPIISNSTNGEVWYYINYPEQSRVITASGVESEKVFIKLPVVNNEEQLWKVEDASGGNYIFTNKKGAQLYYNTTDSRYYSLIPPGTNTASTFQFEAYTGSDFDQSKTLVIRETGGDHINRVNNDNNGDKYSLTGWSRDYDPGNAIQFILADDMFSNYPKLTAPGATPSETYWYYIRSARGGGMYTDLADDGKLLDCLPAIDAYEGQLWKLEGTDFTNFKLINALGREIVYNSGLDRYATSAVSTLNFGLAKSSYDFAGYAKEKIYVITNNVDGGNLDKSNSSTGYGKWSSSSSDGTAVVFLTPSEVTNKIPNPISTSENDERWYTIQFERQSAKAIQDNGTDALLSQATLNNTNPKQLWKFTGSLAQMKIVSYDGNAFFLDGGMTKGVDPTNADKYKFEVLSGKLKIKNEKPSGSQYYLNDYNGDGLSVSQYSIGDNGGNIIFTPVTTLPPYFNVVPEALAFLPEAIGNTSAAKSIAVKTRGLTDNITYEIESGYETVFAVSEAAGWDAVLGGSLNVTFSPQADLNYSVSLTIKCGTYEKVVTLTGRGASGPTIVSDQDDLAFGTITIGLSSETQKVEIMGLILTDDIAYRLEGDDTSAYEIVEESWTGLTGGFLNITFKPTAAKTYNAQLILTSTDAEDKVITLSGVGENTQLPFIVSSADGSVEAWYYINFERGSAYMRDYGLDNAVANQVSKEGEDGQLWKFVSTGISGKYKIVSKTGLELAYTEVGISGASAERFYTTNSSSYTFNFSTYPSKDGWQIFCNEIGRYVNKSNSDLTFGQYLRKDDPGNAVKFIAEAKMTTFTYPKVSNGGVDYWYYIEFIRNNNAAGGLVVQDNGIGNKMTAAQKLVQAPNQLWKITGTEGNYYLTNKNSGETIALVDGAFQSSDTEEDLFELLTLLSGHMSVKRKATSSQSGFNPNGGSNVGNYIGEYGINDGGSALRFVLGLSDDVMLNTLTVSEGTLSPVFDPATTSYTVDVANSVTTIDIDATSNHPNTTIKGTGTKTLAIGENEFGIEVRAQDGTIGVYTVTVIRAVDPFLDETLSSLAPSQGTFFPVFDPYQMSYTVEVPNDATSVELLATASQAGATVAGAGLKNNLIIGENVFEITVTAEDGTSTRTYTVTVIRMSNDANLVELSVSQGRLSPTFSPNVTSYDVAVGSSVTTIDILAVSNQSGARISGIGTKELNIGSNIFEVQVTAQDLETVKVYTITVVREAFNDNADLSALTVSEGSLTPAFSSDVTSYRVEVENSVRTLDIGATSTHSGATIKGTGDAKRLTVGENRFNIVVTAEDGVSTKTYILIVTRKNITDIPQLDKSDVRITSQNGVIYATFEGAKDVKLYSVTGALIDQAMTTNDYTRSVQKGIYVLLIDNKPYKIIAK